MDKIDGIRTFVGVVKAGGFTAAAEKLGISKALASKRVAALERRLGARLINRTSRRLSRIRMVYCASPAERIARYRQGPRKRAAKWTAPSASLTSPSQFVLPRG